MYNAYLKSKILVKDGRVVDIVVNDGSGDKVVLKRNGYDRWGSTKLVNATISADGRVLSDRKIPTIQ